jgi:hypothetical protein
LGRYISGREQSLGPMYVGWYRVWKGIVWEGKECGRAKSVGGHKVWEGIVWEGIEYGRI